jgi:hypothetical protein
VTDDLEDGDKQAYNVFERHTLRWPEEGDELFSAGRDTFIAECGNERSYRLLRGYKFAGDILVQRAISDPSDRDNLIYPALFNYRHYIELALKGIIEDHGAIAGVSLGEKNHRLPGLWRLFLEVASYFRNDPNDVAAVAVGKCIDQISHIDAGSTTFRYARDLAGGVPALPSSLNLVNMHDVMNGIENFFECADLDFTHKTDEAHETAWADQ